MSEKIQQVVDALKNGRPIMIYDSGFREAETDLVFPALNLRPGHIRQLRQIAGGLLFLSISHEIAEAFGLSFLEDVYDTARRGGDHPVLDALKTTDLKYDTRSAFSLTINHRETFTGIPDAERALTCRRFAELSRDLDPTQPANVHIEALGNEFRTPGHIAICREIEGGLSKRRGHTELMVAAARLAEITPVMVAAEILEQDGDRALAIERTREIAQDFGIPLVEGEELVAAMEGR